ncbi:hypothetical protein HU200_060636 [Digitaria exilis]|uniref:Uncharacterized protein n=1 Tax=Digitaria exilis TaxID=1010633 RepID=A0A835AG75_9POAL|nr:hypothetical protein HU200_060636 [Digitaria exilis]
MPSKPPHGFACAYYAHPPARTTPRAPMQAPTRGPVGAPAPTPPPTCASVGTPTPAPSIFIPTPSKHGRRLRLYTDPVSTPATATPAPTPAQTSEPTTPTPASMLAPSPPLPCPSGLTRRIDADTTNIRPHLEKASATAKHPLDQYEEEKAAKHPPDGTDLSNPSEVDGTKWTHTSKKFPLRAYDHHEDHTTRRITAHCASYQGHIYYNDTNINQAFASGGGANPTSWPNNNRSFLFCIVFNSRSADIPLSNRTCLPPSRGRKKSTLEVGDILPRCQRRRQPRPLDKSFSD